MAETNEVVVSGGIKTEAKKRPFWVSEEEKKGLESTPPDNLDVASAIPELTWVEKGAVIGAYVRKDGLVIYHIYKRDRKEIFDTAQAEMDELRAVADQAERQVLQSELANRANADLRDAPWWSETAERLQALFQEHFKHQPQKISYYPEVDSWSVILPEPNMPGALTPQHLEAAISKLALMVEG